MMALAHQLQVMEGEVGAAGANAAPTPEQLARRREFEEIRARADAALAWLRTNEAPPSLQHQHHQYPRQRSRAGPPGL